VKAALSRRLALLEARQGNTARRMHIVMAADENDRRRQMAELVAAGAVGPYDGFVCLTGRPRAASLEV
jgi:hypothetical protein